MSTLSFTVLAQMRGIILLTPSSVAFSTTHSKFSFFRMEQHKIISVCSAQISFLVSFLGAVENSLHNNIDPKNFLEFLNAFDKNAVLEAFKKYSENLLSRSSTFTIDGVKYNNTYFINKVVRYIHDADLASFDDGQAQEFSQEEKQELFDYYRLLGAIKKTVVNNVVYNRADEFIEKDSDVNFVLPNLKHF
jgi:hypothetical protein